MWRGRYVRHLIKHKVSTNTNRLSTISSDDVDALFMIYQYLNDLSTPEEIESDGDNSISSSKGYSGDDAPTIMEDVRGGILSDASGVGLFGGSGLNDENTVKLLIGEKINLNLPIEPEPDDINIINTEDKISVLVIPPGSRLMLQQRCNVCSEDTAHNNGWYTRSLVLIPSGTTSTSATKLVQAGSILTLGRIPEPITWIAVKPNILLSYYLSPLLAAYLAHCIVLICHTSPV